MHDEHPLPGTDVVVDGVRLSVVRHGRDAHEGEPPVVLLHGMGTTNRIWSDVARDLEHEHRCVAPDLVGCGRSERPTGMRHAPASQAELIAGLITTLGHDRAVVVGHDLGGTIAVHLAAVAPQRVRALVLVGSPVHRESWPSPSGVPSRLPARLPAFARLATRTLRGHEDAGAGERRVLDAVDLIAAEAALVLVAADPPPTLVLWGEEDSAISPAYGRRLAGEIPGAVWAPVAGAGHLLPAERPERVAEEICGFLEELPVVLP